MHILSAHPYSFANARRRGFLLAAAATGILAGALPTAATASSGGASLTGVPGAGPVSGPIPQAVDTTVTTSGNGFTVDATQSGMTTHELTFSGVAPAVDAGQTIELERAPVTAGSSAAWSEVAESVVGAGGSFSVPWRTTRGGQFEVRAMIPSVQAQAPIAINDAANGAVGLSTAATATTASQSPQSSGGAGVSPVLTVTIFKAARATIYGPGLYGHRTACGQVLRRTTIGVASRTLKCGTKVSVYYKGQELSVPVIDRGPYGNGATWDLTMATAKAIGVTTTTTIGTLS